MESASEICYYSSQLGITREVQKVEFSNLFNYIFKPGAPSKYVGYNIAEFGSLECSKPEIISFQEVFKKYFRHSDYIDFSTVCIEAEAEFQKCLEGKVAGGNVEVSRSQMATQKEWIRRVNALKRESFGKGARDESELSFKIQLFRQFQRVHASLHAHYYEEREIVKFSEDLKTKIVGDFLALFPSFEEEKDQLAGWAIELGKTCSIIVDQTLAMNKKIRKTWVDRFSVVLSEYKNTMGAFLEQHPLAGPQRLRLFHDEAKRKAETHVYWSLNCTHLSWKASWKAETSKEFQIFEGKLRAARESKIAAYLKGVRADAGRWYKEIFKTNREPGDELDQLLTQIVSEAVARDLDRADGLCGSMNSMMDEELNASSSPCCSKRLRSSALGSCKRAKL